MHATYLNETGNPLTRITLPYDYENDVQYMFYDLVQNVLVCVQSFIRIIITPNFLQNDGARSKWA